MTNPPSSKWRVYLDQVTEGEHKSFRSENKAYVYVREQIAAGTAKVIVHQWDSGGWGLYEVVTPDN
ncbi:hypothetical protein ACIBCT_20955 [Streptosporangium sp. NPDC050855]|uniref:hypothetical protein n=1 Tax=Streptosporangium sp. NPDC050855 TaxID=3366194 RepID=UPI00379D14E5